MDQFFTYRKFKLHYIEFGEGEEYLLAFHGFGCKPDDFKYFEPSLGQRYRVISFSLFHHGRSEYPARRIDKHTLRPSELQGMIAAFLKSKGIEKFSLMGYSIGAKISLACLTYFPEKVRSIYLFAPDGLKYNPWVPMVTGNKAGRGIYRFIIKRPGIFFSAMESLKRYRLLNEKLYLFVKSQMVNPESRLLVYKVWMTYRRIKVNRKEVRRCILGYNINTQLFFGKYDKVIKPSIGKRFARFTGGKAKLHIIYTGHRLISEKTNSYLIKNPGIWDNKN